MLIAGETGSVIDFVSSKIDVANFLTSGYCCITQRNFYECDIKSLQLLEKEFIYKHKFQKLAMMLLNIKEEWESETKLPSKAKICIKFWLKTFTRKIPLSMTNQRNTQLYENVVVGLTSISRRMLRERANVIDYLCSNYADYKQISLCDST